MMQDWQAFKQQWETACDSIAERSDLEKLKVELLGKKGAIAGLMGQMRDLEPQERAAFGKEVNGLKDYFTNKIETISQALENKQLQASLAEGSLDISMPYTRIPRGRLHPVSIVRRQLEEVFISMGYQVVEGPEVELDLYNFERAGIPADHPARDMQDTFFVDVQRLLRTHTTAIQTRVLEAQSNNLPIKVVCPGKDYRRDDDDATHSHQFSQMEGLVVGEGITMGDLKGTLELLAKRMFGESRTIRLRPSYFQFTEPSAEADVSCFACGGKGCSLCKGSGWIEILGSGMVHPNVLEMAGIDSSKYSGFAFGAGLERIAMLKYGIEDIRNLFANDLRFLAHFNRFE